MTDPVRYDASAALRLLSDRTPTDIQHELLQARDQIAQDVDDFNAGRQPDESRQPLDAGFVEFPRKLLDEHASDAETSLIARIDRTATELRKQVDSLVVLGIGGSYMGARALFQALCHPWHNELSREQRAEVPRLYFEGNNVDNDSTSALRDLLRNRCAQPDDPASRWAIIVISKSGGTVETAVSFRLFRLDLESLYGTESDLSRQLVIPVTGAESRLHDLSIERGYPVTFPVPDGIGGRYSIFTAVGLLPAAALGLNVDRLLQGAADMTERFFAQDPGNNPAMDYTAIGHLFEADQMMNERVLSTWGSRLESVGLWYDQLLAESLGKHERGATPLTVVNTRDLHSRGQQHQAGPRNKLITNLYVESPSNEAVSIPASDLDQDQLNRFEGRTLPDVLSAAIRGTNQAYAADRRPTADIVLPQLDEYALGQLFQMLMLATVLEGRLIGINPYGQPGVEAYKRNTMRILGGSQDVTSAAPAHRLKGEE